MSFNTDPSYVSPCNRNNCKCGDSTNCMYYNSAGPGQAHYNFAAVQGAGSPDSRAYQCSSKAYDYFNAKTMYADHALGCMGTYAEEQGIHQQDGRVDFRNELMYGKRDMCDKNFMDEPGGRYMGPMPVFPLFGLEKTHHMLLLAAVIFVLWKMGWVNLGDRRTQMILVAGFLAMFFFFR